MESDELYRILGRITYSYTRIDFLVSHIAKDLNIVATPYEFYSRTKFEKKIDSLKSKINELTDNELKNEFIDWLDELDGLRQDRNTVIHSLILKNSKDENEYRLFNYRKNGDQLITEIYDYKSDDFKQVDKKLIDSHNRGYGLWNRLGQMKKVP